MKRLLMAIRLLFEHEKKKTEENIDTQKMLKGKNKDENKTNDIQLTYDVKRPQKKIFYFL